MQSPRRSEAGTKSLILQQLTFKSFLLKTSNSHYSYQRLLFGACGDVLGDGRVINALVDEASRPRPFGPETKAADLMFGHRGFSVRVHGRPAPRTPVLPSRFARPKDGGSLSARSAALTGEGCSLFHTGFTVPHVIQSAFPCSIGEGRGIECRSSVTKHPPSHSSHSFIKGYGPSFPQKN
ncbi:hypothetical protein Q7C36_020111 [Tachysurus vachellii]|uniref:Uncharacterized protein n=1 Tax=Tachysurus vachellii TaxID=175792 RepID=A0AA88LT25_TACVA|nr:hypothetical protein Q7C36_020111 [Tachysurus vachellii]